MPRSLLALSLATAAAALAAAPVASAGFVDDFDDTSNLNNRAPADLTLEAVGGRLVATKRTAGFAVADFYEDAESIGVVGFGQQSNTFDLSSMPLFEIDDAVAVGGGILTVRAFIYDGADSFIGDLPLQGDTNASGDFSYNVQDAVDNASLGTATAYNITFGVTGNPGEGYTFDSFSAVAVPEPASLALLAAGGLMLVRRRGR